MLMIFFFKIKYKMELEDGNETLYIQNHNEKIKPQGKK